MCPRSNGAFTVVGFGFSGNAPNKAMMFVNLKPFRERKGKRTHLLC